MSERAPLLVHVGYHKTGSTWLQQSLFTDAESRFRLPFGRLDVNERIVAPNHLVFDAQPARDFFEPELEAARAAQRIPVISNERLVGNPHSGGWDSRILAERLRAVFPEARVLLILREQRSVIRSIYFQYVREGGPMSLAGYLHPPRAGAYRIPLFDFDHYAYHRLVTLHQELFGRDRVLVLPYELLSARPRDFVERLCAFAGADVPEQLSNAPRNVSLSAFSVALKRRLNRFFVRDRLNPGAPLAFDRANWALVRATAILDRHLPAAIARRFEGRIRDSIEDEVGDRYASSNQESSERIGIDLSEYGYSI